MGTNPYSDVSAPQEPTSSLQAQVIEIETGLADHDESTEEHGAQGAVSGTENVQTIKNKTCISPTINTPTINTPVIETPDIDGGTVDDITSLTVANDVDIGGHELKAESFESDIATGTAPLVVASETVVANLNVDKVDGLHASELRIIEGAVLSYAGASAPTGYLECDGSSLDRTTYAALFAIIGVMYGNADGTHFNLPDYRGQFLRGYDNGATNDPDAASRTDRGDGTTGDSVGTKQDHELDEHLHTYLRHNNTVAAWFAFGGNTCLYNQATKNTSSVGGNETRPINIGVMYIIKY